MNKTLEFFVGSSSYVEKADLTVVQPCGSPFAGEGVGQSAQFTKYDDTVHTMRRRREIHKPSEAPLRSEKELTSILRAYVQLDELESVLRTPQQAPSLALIENMERILNETIGNLEREATIKRRLGELEWKLDTISSLSWARSTSLPRDVVASSVDVLGLMDSALTALPHLCEVSSRIKQMDLRWRGTVSKMTDCAAVYVALLETKQEIDQMERAVSEANSLLTEFSQSVDQFHL